MINKLITVYILLVATASQASCQSATSELDKRDTTINTNIFYLKKIDKGPDNQSMTVWENRADSNEFIVKSFTGDKTTGFVHYKNRKAEGYFFIGFDNGAMMQEGTFKNGKLDGTIKGYYEDGSPASIYIMKDDKKIDVKYFDRKKPKQ
ncbi:toxin-antitoxin system YwqK family antitoxin [Chitinophaga vietnamensis]|uniref:toxin-antitoxin system YwqK family antitoxin n=1 Tax=Chitinophaga vietnamensis TaxID=2593957 RepID=UPI00117744CE|nr:hypothetical protein [Chitinophaga vietnamensis]